MSNEEKTSSEETIKKRFETIKELCDSAIALFVKTGAKPAETDIDSAGFEITEKIQEEIEEIRDLLFEGE
jgi:hypothetical protein